jgi:shikimate kinase
VVKSNVVLIGMPGSGKTTIGKLLSRMLIFNFIDCDEYIEQMEGTRLQRILDEKGAEEFKRIERARLLELNLSNYVIAPGGSIIYSFKAVKHLKKSSILVFLNVSLVELQRRIYNISTRGIIGLETKTFAQLYHERLPLYLKYADIIVRCNGKSKMAITKEICCRVTRSLHNVNQMVGIRGPLKRE